MSAGRAIAIAALLAGVVWTASCVQTTCCRAPALLGCAALADGTFVGWVSADPATVSDAIRTVLPDDRDPSDLRASAFVEDALCTVEMDPAGPQGPYFAVRAERAGARADAAAESVFLAILDEIEARRLD